MGDKNSQLRWLFSFSHRHPRIRKSRHCAHALPQNRRTTPQQTQNNMVFERSGSTPQMVYQKPPDSKDVLRRRASLTAMATAVGHDHKDFAKELIGVADHCRQLGKLDQAVPKYEDAIKIISKSSGADCLEVANCLHKIAIVLHHVGDFDRALNKYKQALDITVCKLGYEHEEVARILNNMGETYRQDGRYEEALDQLEEALRIKKKVSGPDSLDVASSLNNLGILYQEIGGDLLEKGLEKFEESLQIKIKIHGREDPNVAKSMINIGQAHLDFGDHNEGRIMLQDGVEILAKVAAGDPTLEELFLRAQSGLARAKKLEEISRTPSLGLGILY